MFRAIAIRIGAVLAVVLVALGVNAGAAQAMPREIEIGPVTVCSAITIFDIVIFEYDCVTY
jgi:hypothetical protein